MFYVKCRGTWNLVQLIITKIDVLQLWEKLNKQITHKMTEGSFFSFLSLECHTLWTDLFAEYECHRFVYFFFILFFCNIHALMSESNNPLNYRHHCCLSESLFICKFNNISSCNAYLPANILIRWYNIIMAQIQNLQHWQNFLETRKQ